jgi:hypothetical protein
MNTRVLTSDTVPAEKLGAYVGHDWRATAGLRAGWSVAFGPVTQVLFLQDAETPLPVPPPGIQLEARKRQFLREVSPHRPTGDGITIFDLRCYDPRVGAGAAFLELMLATLPVRERYSRNFGVWQALSGRDEQVLHLWGYRDLSERDLVRAHLKSDAEWQTYISTILPMLQFLNSTILVPLPFCA